MSRLWANDEELAKKDDDLNARQQGPNGQWQSAVRTPRRRSVARLVAYVFAACLIVFTISRLFGSNGDSVADAYANRITSNDMPHYDAPRPPSGGKNDGGGQGMQVEQKKTYSGPVKLPQLGQSLHAIAGTQGKQTKNRNVLFAAASLKSAATLLPLACQMALERQNYVHFAFMGRSDIALKELVKLNGIDDECQLILHDARPDYTATSTETRMSICTARAMRKTVLCDASPTLTDLRARPHQHLYAPPSDSHRFHLRRGTLLPGWLARSGPKLQGSTDRAP